jgi:uroporphyrinogen-III synthase
MKKSLFISRDQLNETWTQPLIDQGWEVRGESLITFKNVAINAIPDVDWIAFYSSVGVHYFLEALGTQRWPTLQLTENQIIRRNTGERILLSAIGPGTASALQKRHFVVDHIGTGEPFAWGESLMQVAGGKRILSPQARISKSALAPFYDQARITPMICYNNKPVHDPALATESFLLFTSPLNVEAYFRRHERQEGQTIIALGATTATALAEWGIQSPYVPEQPDLKFIADWLVQTFPD